MMLKSIDDCKQNLNLVLDFYFDVINVIGRKEYECEMERDRDLWLQIIFSKGCQFAVLLDGVGYSKGIKKLNPIIDFSILFTIVRCLYESLVAFELLFVIPKTQDQQTIIYNLFVAHGLSERLKDLDEDMRMNNPERIKNEEEDIAVCKKAIEATELYKNLNNQEKAKMKNAFGKKYRYVFSENNSMDLVAFEDAYKLLNIKDNCFYGSYSFFSLHGHPSYLSLIQFRDAYQRGQRFDFSMAYTATYYMLSLMCIFIIDYMGLNKEIKELYNQLDDLTQRKIKFYERVLRCDIY